MKLLPWLVERSTNSPTNLEHGTTNFWILLLKIIFTADYDARKFFDENFSRECERKLKKIDLARTSLNIKFNFRLFSTMIKRKYNFFKLLLILQIKIILNWTFKWTKKKNLFLDVHDTEEYAHHNWRSNKFKWVSEKKS